FETSLMTIYTVSREPILLAGRLTSTGFKRKPPKQKPKKSRTLSDGDRLFCLCTLSEPIGLIENIVVFYQQIKKA
ncbi:hypothetical protein J7950_23215, partial [Vibrio parahaemolyticus]|nr:hypothetical protein [Vibrio parahaemolyticus]